MKLVELQLTDFRNYVETKLSFYDGVHIFIGENAQGKTNLMEAIYTLAMTKSHRTSSDRELIRWQQNTAIVKGVVQKKISKIPLELQISKKGKTARVNHLEQKKLSSYLGQLNVILFAPENLEIVKGSPANRRKFMDMELGQMSPIYLHELVTYQKILKQRNAYLKHLSYQKKGSDTYLEVLTDQLIEKASLIVFHRLAFIRELEALARPIHQQISVGKEEFSVAYHTQLPLEGIPTSEQLSDMYRKQFELLQKRELEQMTTLIGPHRDDLIFYLNHKPVQTYGSQGQQRTTVLSLKLAEIELMKTITGEYPLLLLDDVLSELDADRQTHLIKAIEKKVQTFITTTNLDSIQQQFIQKPTIYPIKHGQVKA